MNNKTVSAPSKKGSYVFVFIAIVIVLGLAYKKEILETWNKREYYIAQISNKYKEHKANAEAKKEAKKQEEERKNKANNSKKNGVYSKKYSVVTSNNTNSKGKTAKIVEPFKEEVFDYTKNTSSETTELLKTTLSRSDYNVKKIKALLDAGADVNAKTYGDTIFVDAIEGDTPVEIIKMLVDNGADLKYRNYERHDLFVLAAKRAKNPEIITFLTQKGFECETIPNSHNANHLLFAAEYNENLEVIKIFTKICEATSMDDFGENALFFVLEHHEDRADIFEMLIKEGVPANIKNIHGATLLTKAAEKRADIGVFTALVDAGVNVNDVTTQYKNNALHYAYDNPAVVKLLIGAGIDVNQESESSDVTPIISMLKYDVSPEVISLLINAGAKLDVKGNYENTPLHVAATNSRVETIDLLVKKGANQNAQNYYGQTPLMVLLQKYNPTEEKVMALIQGDKIDLEVKDKSGDTALSNAVAYNADLTEAIKPIVEKGANINSVNNNGRSILNKAINRGVPADTIKYLIEKGADVKEKGLIFEVFNNSSNVAIISHMIRAGADLKSIDKSGYTPLARAINGKYKPEIISLMIDYGADIGHKLPSGLSMLDLAKSRYNENDEVISILINTGAR